MKLILILGVSGIFCFLSSAFAADCPDFSGSYSNANTGSVIALTVQQEGCQKLDLSFNIDGSPSSSTILIDGTKHLYSDSDQRFALYQTYTWSGNTILIDYEQDWTHGGQTIHVAGKLSLDSSKDLIEQGIDFLDNGQIYSAEPIVFERQ
jgi:hypothetical protein